MISNKTKNCYFIAVNYNSSIHTIKYLDSIEILIKHDKSKIKIIIVDNASSLEDFKVIENNISMRTNIELIRNKENIGYFRALNVGLSIINEKEAFIVIGNNDIEFEKDFLVKLNKIHYEDEVLVIAPNVITKDGYHQNPHCLKRLSVFRKTGYKIYYLNYYLGQMIFWMVQKIKKPKSAQREEDWNRKRVIHMGIGACYILTENFFKYFTMLDNRIFLWGEEALLAGQVLSVHGKILYDPTIIVHHNENGSVAAIPSKQSFIIAKRSHKIYSKYL